MPSYRAPVVGAYTCSQTAQGTGTPAAFVRFMALPVWSAPSYRIAAEALNLTRPGARKQVGVVPLPHRTGFVRLWHQEPGQHRLLGAGVAWCRCGRACLRVCR
jgi:hypothetical protein